MNKTTLPTRELSSTADFDVAADELDPTDDVSALAALAQSSVAELRFLRVDESDDQICLSGRVRSFYHKQLAQETVRSIAGGRRVVNDVLVQ
ncbi:MAG: BON domain-containing protein [Planctomycetota bacterium]